MAFKLHRLSGSPRCLNVEWHGDVCAVSFRNSSLDESWIEDMAEELYALIDRHGSRKLVVSLSGIDCLYSLLLGKLLTARRLMHSYNGHLRLSEAAPYVREVFHVCCLDKFFEFYTTREEAIQTPWP